MSDDLQFSPIIRTKLYRPPVAADFVPRERLLRKLDEGFRLPFTLVSAPAGYGKSSLISHWLQNHDSRSSWLSLDKTHGSLRSFLQYFTAALQTISPTLCRDTQALLKVDELPPVETLAGFLCNELDVIDERVVLALDDYYRIKETKIHEFVDCLLGNASHRLHLVIMSRWDPPFSLSTLRGKHLMTEIRLQDLQFTREDSVAFLEEKIGRQVSRDSLENLAAKTEGWPVALRLISLALQNRSDPEELIDSISGDSGHLQEYLVAEILSKQSKEFRDCLCRTSILDRFCARLSQDLCDLQCGGDCVFHEGYPGQAFPAVDLFCIPLDDRGEWFRFHHLLQDLLNQHLHQSVNLDGVSGLHKRSALWFEEEGLPEEALQHFLKAGDPNEAGRLIVRCQDQILQEEQWNRLEQWINWLPPGIVEENPELLLLKAWLLQNRCRYSDSIALLDRIEEFLDLDYVEAARLERCQGSLNALRSSQRYIESLGEPAIECGEKALLQLPANCLLERGEAIIFLSAAHQMVGNLKRARAVVYEELAVDSLERSSTYHCRLLAALCFVDWMAADLFTCRRSALQMVELGDETGLPESSAVGRYFVGIADYQLNHLSEAEASLGPVVTKSIVANLEYLAQSAFAQASIYESKGESPRANEVIDSLLDEMLRIRNTEVLSLAKAFRAELDLRQGFFFKAGTWAEQFVPEPFYPMWRFHSPHITFAKVLISQNSVESKREAEQLLKKLEEYLTETHNQRFLIEVLALQAMLLQNRGHVDEAISRLRRAVSLAQPGGFIRLFLDLGSEVVSLLKGLDADEEQSRYIGQIIGAFRESESDRSIAAKSNADASLHSQDLIEPLTNREIEILNLLGNRLTNKEIADRLNIAPATVKRHAENLYGKLGVSSRREAAVRARHLGILSR